MANLAVNVTGVSFKKSDYSGIWRIRIWQRVRETVPAFELAVLQLKEQQDSLVPEIRLLVSPKLPAVC